MRITVRCVCAGELTDAERAAALRLSPRLAEYRGWGHLLTIGEGFCPPSPGQGPGTPIALCVATAHRAEGQVDHLYVEAVFVHPDRRRQGCCRALCEAAAELGALLGLQAVVLDVARADERALGRVYAAAGFAPLPSVLAGAGLEHGVPLDRAHYARLVRHLYVAGRKHRVVLRRTSSACRRAAAGGWRSG